MPPALKVKLNEYNSKIKIMSILCNKASGWNNGVKNILSFFTILISAGVAIISGILDDNMKIPTIILNSIIVFLLSLDRGFKFSEKSANFHKYSQSYNRLSHDIDKIVDNQITPEFLNLIISLYDNITDGINEDFPTSIIIKMKNEYSETEQRFLPLILTDGYSPIDIGASSPLRRSFKEKVQIPMDPITKRERFLTSNLSFHNSDGSLIVG